MLARVRAWWRRRSPAERLLFGAGVPLVAVAALFGRARERAETTEAAAENAEGGEGTLAVLPGNVANAGAGGVDAGQFAQFLESFTAEIGNLEQRLDAFENDRPGFGQNPNTGAQEQAIEACVAAVTRRAPDVAAQFGTNVIRSACVAAVGDPTRAVVGLQTNDEGDRIGLDGERLLTDDGRILDGSLLFGGILNRVPGRIPAPSPPDSPQTA